MNVTLKDLFQHVPIAYLGSDGDNQLSLSPQWRDTKARPHDNRYTVKRGRYSVVIIDFVCILCCHDPTKAFWDRMNPHSNKVSDVVDHSLDCAKTACKRIAKGDHYCLEEDGRLRCPDPACEGVLFDHIYKLFNHLFFIHMFKIHGCKVGPRRSAEEYLLKSCAELEDKLGIKVDCDACSAANSGSDGSSDGDDATRQRKKARV